MRIAPISTLLFIFPVFCFSASAASDPDKALFIDNGDVRLGVDLESGGSVFFFAESRRPRNLLNHNDRGRFVQQSYYGEADGSLWNKKPWRWNPVQGGDWKGKPAKVLDSRATSTTLYVKSRPMHWASGADIDDAVMEQWIELDGQVAHIRYAFTYTGATSHKARHQEMPAVFVDYALENLVFYRGDKPWRTDALTSIVPGWPNERHRRDEDWAAFVDGKGWGVGVYTPDTPEMTCYRHKGKPGPKGPGCSYFAPIRTLAIAKDLSLTYDVYLTIGEVKEIRGRFSEVHSRRSQGKLR